MTLNSQGLFEEKVIEVQHYTDRLFRFRITRPQSFRFRSGEFVMVGLEGEAKPLLRAYSVASPSWDESLEFYSIKVPDGPLTSRLQNIKEGDTILMRPKTTGTLVHDGWSVLGGWQHNLSKTLAVQLVGSYADSSGDSRTLYALNADLVWSPVTNFSVTGALLYTGGNWVSSGWNASLSVKKSW